VPWDWGVSCLIRCAVHRTPLLEGCAACGESDPIAFTAPDQDCNLRCHSCGESLVEHKHDIDERDANTQTVEDAYRAALAGTVPTLLNKATSRGFRLFVEEMFHLLNAGLNTCARGRQTTFSRKHILEIIGALVLNVSPGAAASTRSRRDGIRLWTTLLSFIPEHIGATMERTSLRWPAALRRRFLSGLYHRTRQRWPYTPYRPATHSARPLTPFDIAGVYGLRPTVSNRAYGLSSI
jgi:hypothetical protein